MKQGCMAGVETGSEVRMKPVLHGDEVRYGIRVVHEGWATIDGGPDLVGRREEIEAVVKRWQADAGQQHPDERTLYEVKEYTGIDPAEPTVVEEFLSRTRSSG